MGGLGNQLFQVNFGIWLQNRYQTKVSFNNYLVQSNIITKTLGWTIHEFFLEELVDLKVDLLCEGSLASIVLSKIRAFNSYSYYSGVSDWRGEMSRNHFGYFQDRSFLEKSYGNIQLRPGLLDASRKNDTIMHLRGTDMNDREQAMSYYSNVLDELEASEIYVVTTCQETLSYLRRKFLAKHDLIDVGSSGRRDFLTCCSANTFIAAPSTFSWWAARLGRAKKIIIPRKMRAELGSPRVDQSCLEILI
jgi:hypothetical protein